MKTIIQRVRQLYIRKLWNGVRYASSLGVTIGDNCNITTRIFWGSEPYLIKIGNNVQITDGVRFFTHGGGWVIRKRYPTFDVFGKIVIGDNVYIGNNAMIMPGVTIGNNVIIGAGSIVTKSVPNESIVGGNPAKIIGNIQDFERRMLPFNMNTKGMSYENKKQYILSMEDNMFIKK